MKKNEVLSPVHICKYILLAKNIFHLALISEQDKKFYKKKWWLLSVRAV